MIGSGPFRGNGIWYYPDPFFPDAEAQARERFVRECPRCGSTDIEEHSTRGGSRGTVVSCNDCHRTLCKTKGGKTAARCRLGKCIMRHFNVMDTEEGVLVATATCCAGFDNVRWTGALVLGDSVSEDLHGRDAEGICEAMGELIEFPTNGRQHHGDG